MKKAVLYISSVILFSIFAISCAGSKLRTDVENADTSGQDMTSADGEATIFLWATLLSEPEGASVFIDEDEEPACTTPCQYEVAEGDHTFTFELEDYETAVVDHYVTWGDSTVSATLISGTEETVFTQIDSSPQGAMVAIDGRAGVCVTPCEPQELTVGEHEFVFELTGYLPETVVYDVSFTDNYVFATLTQGQPGLIAVQLNSTPSGASVTVDSAADVCTTPCQYQTTAGMHTFSFSLSGYQPAMVQHNVTETDNTVSVTLQPGQAQPVMAQIDSSPQGASVAVDSAQNVCTTPCSYQVTEGQHVFGFSLSGYQSTQVTHFVSLSDNYVFAVLTPETTQPVTVQINSTPAGASVAIDGLQNLCTTPCSQQLTEGTHEFVFTLSGYETATVQQSVSQNSNTVNVTLTPASAGEVSVNIESTPPGASVAIDGEQNACITPCTELLSVGMHTFVFTLDGYESETVQQNVSTDGDTVSITLTPESTGEMVTITISSVPMMASVSIDGNSVGTTPFSGDVEAGSHQLQIEKPPCDPVNETIDVSQSNKSFFYQLQNCYK